MDTNKKDEKKNWYAIYTRARAEKKVLERINKAGHEAYVPIIEEIRYWSDRKKKVDVVLIKSYVFVHVEEKTIFDLLSIEGTVRVLRYLGKPAIIKDYEIKNLKLLCSGNVEIDRVSSTDKLQIGSDVEVEYGPLMGLHGKCVEIKGNKRVMVEIKSLSNQLLVDVPVRYLKILK